MTHHDDHKDEDRDDPAEEGQVPGPTDDSDAATEADAGLPGSPAVSYTPGGMDDEGDSDT